MFAILTVPVIVTIVAINYFANERTVRDSAEALVARFRVEALSNIHKDFEPIKSMVLGAAEVGSSQPEFYTDNRSRDYL
ncbi:MAG: hypothetical protein WD005_02605, partial [Haliea sp.]